MRGVLAVMLLASTLPLSAGETPGVPQAVAALEYLKARPNTGPVAWTAGPYHYDGAGNVDAVGPESFVYDKIGRLKSATMRGPDLTALQTQTYTYDPYGNLIQTGKLGQTVDLSATANRLDAATYDASGNVTGWGTYRYGYDAAGMMNTIYVGASLQPRVIYAYTADDERLFAFDTATNTTHWTVRGFDNKVLRDFRQNGSTWTVERDYVYRDGLLLAAIKPDNAAEHYTLDHLGSPRLITDATGHKIGYHVYWPFGEEWMPGNPQEGVPLRFTGHERDADPAGGSSPLDSMHARYYRAEWGRFLAADLIPGEASAPQSWNMYAYVRSNPLRYSDPSGLTLVANTTDAQNDLCAMIGPTCSQHLSFDAHGKVSVKATSAELKGNEALQLINDMVSSSNVYGAWVGTRMPSGNKSLILGDRLAGTYQVVNLSKTVRIDIPLSSNRPLPSGYDGAVGIFSGYAQIAVGADGRPVSRPLVLFHELAENYERSEKMKQYVDSHKNAVQRESILRVQQPQLNQYTLGSGPNQVTLKP